MSTETISNILPFVVILGLLAGFLFLIYYSHKKSEEKRIGEILSHQTEWGEEMCKWLVGMSVNLKDMRVAKIMQRYNEFGKEVCQKLLQKTLSIGMTDEMVMLALGQPSSVDNREISERGEKFRWIYGTPRQGAAYIWFKDGKVVKIKH
jgi:hypothetical protein